MSGWDDFGVGRTESHYHYCTDWSELLVPPGPEYSNLDINSVLLTYSLSTHPPLAARHMPGESQ